MNVSTIRVQFKRKTPLLVIFAAIICVLSCKETMPPMSEYQFVTAIPMDKVERGMLFIVDSTLYVLHHTGSQYYLNIIEQYNISNPVEPTFENATYLSIPVYSWSRIARYRHYAFFFSDPGIVRVNLSTIEAHSRSVDFGVYDLACNDQYLFLNTNSGLRIWDVTLWPEYTEVYYDSMTRYSGRTALFDTVLCELYRTAGYEVKYAFWNINGPDVILEGDWSFNMGDIEMYENYLIHSTGQTIQRFSLGAYDTLALEDSVSLGGIDDFLLLDSLIYLLGDHRFIVVALNDFDDYVITSLLTGLSNPNALALAVYKDVVFILAHKSGILVFERREL